MSVNAHTPELTIARLREMLSTHKELAEKLDALERTVSTHDQAIAGLVNAIRELTHTPASRSNPIGFTADLDGGQE